MYAWANTSPDTRKQYWKYDNRYDFIQGSKLDFRKLIFSSNFTANKLRKLLLMMPWKMNRATMSTTTDTQTMVNGMMLNVERSKNEAASFHNMYDWTAMPKMNNANICKIMPILIVNYYLIVLIRFTYTHDVVDGEYDTSNYLHRHLDCEKRESAKHDCLY